MANTCESALGIVMLTSQMRLTGLNQKVRWQESRSMGRGSWPLSTRSISRCLRSRTPKAERGNPVSPPGTGQSPIFPPLLPKIRGGRPGSFRLTQSARSSLPSEEARVVPAHRAEARQANRKEGPRRCGKGNWKKRRPVCNGSDTGSEFARRESELTSSRCHLARSLAEPLPRRNGDG